MKSAQVAGRAMTIVAGAMLLYHLVSTQYLVQGPFEHQDTHIGLALIVVFLASMSAAKNRLSAMVALVLLALSIGATGYIRIFFGDLQVRGGILTMTDTVVGITLALVTLEATRRAFGPVVVVVALIFISYAFVSPYLPVPLYHSPIRLQKIVAFMNMGFNGMFGTFLGVSANYIFLFLVFGGILQSTRAKDFVLQLGSLVGRRLRGGPAQMAVVSSAVIGTVTGTGVANVAIAGPFTIPLMKSAGYTPEQAGAIEASASTVGAVMPPIMGAAAFLMAGIIGVPYAEIAAAAVVPALLYVLAIGTYAELQARKMDVQRLPMQIDFRALSIGGAVFLIPLGILITILALNYSPMYAAFYAVVSIAVLSLIADFVATGKRPPLKPLFDGAMRGTRDGAQIAVVCGALGVMFGVLSVTGLGIKIGSVIELLGGGNLLQLLIVAMVVSLILGTAMPPVVCYILVAITVVPVVTRMGVPLLPAHFFPFYFGMFATVTPPVAMGALVASSIAKGNYIKTALLASGIVAVTFITPYVMIWNPSLYGRPPDMITGAASILAMVLATFAFAVVMNGYYFLQVNLAERLLAAIACILFIAYAATAAIAPTYILLAVGVVIIGLVTAWQMRRRQPAAALSPSS